MRLNKQKILVEDPLYREHQLQFEDKDERNKILYDFAYNGTIDSYCLRCNAKTVFTLQNPYGYGDKPPFKETDVLTVHAQCPRNDSDFEAVRCQQNLYFNFYIEGDKITKIGQHPNKATLDFADLDSAFDELEKSFRIELGSAIGLHSHGVGIGSFVYLRRIFEKLINEAKDEAEQSDSFDKEAYGRSRMTEKILLLKDHLPSRLVSSASLYGVLSKGIHELSEEECKEKFPIILQAIKLILSQRHEEKKFTDTINKVTT